MSLQNVQAEIADLILNDDAETQTIFPADNIIIYQNNALQTLLRTLRDTYPLILKLVGEDFFHVAAKEYIQQYPSRSSNLHDYGEYFSRFLAQYPPVKHLIYLVEVAEFEWICHTLYFAADHPGFDPSRLRTLTAEQYENVHFALHPASRVVKFHYPLLAIVDLCKHNPDAHVDINSGGVNLLIIRRELEIMLVQLNNADFAFLEALQENMSLADALERAYLYATDFNLEARLPKWIQDKTIVDCL